MSACTHLAFNINQIPPSQTAGLLSAAQAVTLYCLTRCTDWGRARLSSPPPLAVSVPPPAPCRRLVAPAGLSAQLHIQPRARYESRQFRIIRQLAFIPLPASSVLVPLLFPFPLNVVTFTRPATSEFFPPVLFYFWGVVVNKAAGQYLPRVATQCTGGCSLNSCP